MRGRIGRLRTAVLAGSLGVAIAGSLTAAAPVAVRRLQASADCPEPLPVALAAPEARRGAAPRERAGEAGRATTSYGTRLAWHAQPGLERLATRLADADAVFGPLPGIGALEAALPQPPAAYLLGDLGCLDALGLGGALPDWVAGVASRDGRFLALRADPGSASLGSLRVTLRHEIAHLALRAATDGNLPRWLNEGYAQYAAGGWNWQEAWRLRLLMLTGGQGMLRELSLRFPADPQRARLAYQLSYTAVHELARLGGDAGLRATFAALRDGSTLDAAMRRVYGLTEGQFEARWQRAVTQRYGVLYILSRATLFWLAVTMLLLWVGWRRRRRDRERMGRLLEEERADEQRREAEQREREARGLEGPRSGLFNAPWGGA